MSGIVLEDFNDGNGYYKVNLAEINKEQVEEIKNLVKKWNPELEESEDERIRKILRERIIRYDPNNEILIKEEGISQKQFIAWLEKQGNEPNWYHHKVDLSNCSEKYRKAYYDGWNNCNMQHSQCKSESDDVVKCLINGMKFYYEDNENATWGTDKWSMPVKHIIEVLEKIDGQKPDDKADSKFHEGEWITNGDYIWKIVDIKPLDYILQSQDGNIVDDTISHVDEHFHSFTIQDAKDGDVLYMNNGLSDCIFIYKSFNNTIIYKHASYNKFGFEGEHYLVLNDGYVCPASKEQRDTLFIKMKEAGYEWNAETKELKKIEQKPETKFHEGEWIVTDKKTVLFVNKIYESDYHVIDTKNWVTYKYTIKVADEKCHLWTIKDANDGDVLTGRENNVILMFRGIGNKNWNDVIDYYCRYDYRNGDFIIQQGVKYWGNIKNTQLKPATKEQRVLFFLKMQEAGYEWDSEKKTLKNFNNEEFNGEDYGIDSLWHAQRILEKTLGNVDGYQSDDGILEHKCAISAVKKLYKQKPNWSEEDEAKLNSILFHIEDVENKDVINWFKSLKDRVQPKQECN